jgi:hypothetical protein
MTAANACLSLLRIVSHAVLPPGLTSVNDNTSKQLLMLVGLHKRPLWRQPQLAIVYSHL